jgi:hypothetical protein
LVAATQASYLSCRVPVLSVQWSLVFLRLGGPDGHGASCPQRLALLGGDTAGRPWGSPLSQVDMIPTQ